MIKNILKIVFLGVVGFGVLVYITAPEQKNIAKDGKKVELTTASLPSHLELIGESKYIRKENFFSSDKETFIIVANHDSLIVLNELYKYTDKKNILIVANISKTPWIIKKLAVNGKLEELYKDSTIKIVNDSNGSFVNALNLNDITQNRYFIYKVKDNKISFISKAQVPLDALQKGISQEEKKNYILNIVKSL